MGTSTEHSPELEASSFLELADVAIEIGSPAESVQRYIRQASAAIKALHPQLQASYGRQLRALCQKLGDRKRRMARNAQRPKGGTAAWLLEQAHWNL